MRPETRPGLRPEPGSGADRPGRWHRTDWMALLSGLLFLTVGILYLSVPSLHPGVMLPVVLGGLACAGFVAVIARAVRR
ncbi:hypothetical protein HS048_08530 [Planomonospora sp. ID91781]|uniref:Uncharacterized protein n=4 Tax=Planomonospora TaxID=1998 RepID=A0A171CCX5_9ACTN|nr:MULTISPECIES: hypothetical protein [Planomonospora]MBG0820777.1 hypothetical protein [Planomonospora sp. ID91781]GAT66519.1 hypothetical protein PS9374_02169 [Planomonospora sphaerica]GGK55949.1 hypothetical protein GCM10010126_14460 [Planomonospora parontospora]GII07314.1 hypothetical protein Ppa06_11120 [Planomonospora parontospora subsp. parontospora]